jgi:hypothetical protein
MSTSDSTTSGLLAGFGGYDPEEPFTLDHQILLDQAVAAKREMQRQLLAELEAGLRSEFEDKYAEQIAARRGATDRTRTAYKSTFSNGYVEYLRGISEAVGFSIPTLPATPGLIANYFSILIEMGADAAKLRRELCAISFANRAFDHPDPADSPLLRAMVKDMVDCEKKPKARRANGKHDQLAHH